MDTIFMNSVNSKNLVLVYLLNLSGKINLKGSDKYIAPSSFSLYYTWKNSHVRTINLKYLLQHGMKNLNYLMDHIPYQIFKIIYNI